MCSAVGCWVPDVRTASSTTASCGVGRRPSRPPSAIAYPPQCRPCRLGTTQVAHETLTHLLRDRGLAVVGGVIDRHGQRRTLDEPRVCARGERKANVLHRRQLRLALPPLFEDTRHTLARNVEPDVVVEAAQPLQLLAD